MGKSNKDRFLIKILKEIASDLNLDINFLCYNWIISISNNNTSRHIFGYEWELNSSTSQLIAKDKSACYEVLNSQKISAVEHKLFLNPQLQNYVGSNGNWKKLLEFAEYHNYKFVCKSNSGTGGNEVFKINNQIQFEDSVHTLFTKHRGICVCPFYEIEMEYRVIILDGAIQIIYAKEKPHIIGDGKSTILELLKNNGIIISSIDLDENEIELLKILSDKEVLFLGWKHNLGKGAKPIIIEEGKLKDDLCRIAISAANAINITFASVDIIKCKDDLLVMEINSGIMMENFSQENEINYSIAKKIYKNAVAKMLEL